MKILLSLIIGWLIPGAGHWLYNKRLKGSILFGLVVLCLVIGLVLSDFRSIRFYDNPFYYLARFGCGLSFIVTRLFTEFVPAGRIPLSYHDIGFLYVAVGGAINVVVLLSLYQPADIKTGLSGDELSDSNKSETESVTETPAGPTT